MTPVAEIAGRALQTRYALREKLGAGGQGEVWRAYDTQRGVDVAIKILHAAPARSELAWAALAREHALASRLDHPGILKVFSPEHAGTDLMLPMELAPGGDLRRLRGAGYLLVLPVLIEVAQALEHAHERGVIHRDLKPGNVLFDAQGRAKLADFGASGIADAGRDPASRASPFSASPQQLRGEPATPADDIYGLGALAYELLSHYPPHYPHFDAQRMQEEPVPELQPAEPIPALLSAHILRMLEKDAARRPASMHDVIEQFERALNDTVDFEAEQPPRAVEAANRTLPPDERILSTQPVPADAPVTVRIPTVVGPLPPPLRVPVPAPAPAPRPVTVAPAPVPVPRPVTVAPASGARGPLTSAPLTVAPPPVTAPAMAARSARDIAAAHMGGAPRHSRSAHEPPRIVSTSPPVPRSVEPHEVVSPHLPWEGLPPARTPPLMRLEPMRDRSGAGLLMLVLLVAAALAAWYWLPQYARGLPPALAPLARSLRPDAFAAARPAQPAANDAAAEAAAEKTLAANRAETTAGRPQTTPAAAGADARTRLQADQAVFDSELTSLEARAAPVWAGSSFADAKRLGARAARAYTAGNLALSRQWLNQATRQLARVEHAAPAALAAQLAAGDRALAEGRTQAAAQAYDLARRIDPHDEHAAIGQAQVRSRGEVGPLLTSGREAQRAGDYPHAVSNYSRVLALDPDNQAARAGLAESNAALTDEEYATAAGEGFAALGAGRLADARAAFERAHALRPEGAAAVEGLRRVDQESHFRVATGPSP
jgi:tetratricopeptide (TPR) repeat protein